jgi:cell division protease FtsH
MSRAAKPGPPPDPAPKPEPSPPSAWRSWLLPIGLMLTILLVFLPSMWSAPSTPSVPFTDLLSKVDTGQVESVGINEQGAIKGTLRDGT